MSSELGILVIAAASIGFFHTLMGPDHYLPFIVIAKARRWSLVRTTWITLLCGLGHVGSSVVLGALGIAAGIALTRLELTESVRGQVAAWLLTAFGIVYCIWGVRRAIRNRPHTHRHLHKGGDEHLHSHVHDTPHAHPHEQPGRGSLTPWVLFLVFIFGPCEPLIPLLMWPAAARSAWGVALVAAVFGVVTIATMLAVVLLSTFGLSFVPFRRLERYSHAIAGATIFLCGLAIHMGL